MNEHIGEKLYEIIPIQHPDERIVLLGKITLFDWEIDAPELSTLRGKIDAIFVQSDIPSDSIDVETYRRIAKRFDKK